MADAEHQDEGFLVTAFREIAGWIYDASGIEVPRDLIRFEVYKNPRGRHRFREGLHTGDIYGLAVCLTAIFLEEKLHRRVDVVPGDTIKSEIRNAVMKEAIYI